MSSMLIYANKQLGVLMKTNNNFISKLSHHQQLIETLFIYENNFCIIIIIG